MKDTATLSVKEKTVTELIAWGASKKEVANMLSLPTRTVESMVRKIFIKTDTAKSNELSAWWFCTRYNIPYSESPLTRKFAS